MSAVRQFFPAPLLLLWLAVSTLCAPLLLRTDVSSYTWDERNYHQPAVRQIAERWPALDLRRDSLSATAPGYQWFLAGVSRVVGTGERPLRVVNLLVSLGALAILWHALPLAAAERMVLLLPLALSNFFVKSASHVVTDNAALLAVAASLSAVLVSPAGRPGRAGCWAAAAVAVRQSNVWLFAPLALANLLSSAQRSRPAAWIAALLPVGVLGILVVRWGGLVPPEWTATHLGRPGFSLLTNAAYLLGVAALLAPAYAWAVRAALDGNTRRKSMAIGGVVGLAVALLAVTAPDYEAGRWGGYLWSAAEKLPVVQGRSVLFLLLAPLGGAALACLISAVWKAAPSAPRVVWTTAFGGWAASGLVNQQTFHRYFEPMMLVLLILAVALVYRAEPGRLDRRALLLLAVFQSAVTFATAHARTFGLL